MATRRAPAESLALRLDSEDLNLMEWLEAKGEATYPEIGARTWRVPPVRFNVQKMHEVKAGPRGKGASLVLDLPAPTDQESCYVENLVFSAFENLSDAMLKQRDGKALFLITNFEYDNYLNKLDLTAWMKGKQHKSDPTPAKNDQISNQQISATELVAGINHDSRMEDSESPPKCQPGSDRKHEELPADKESGRKRYSDTTWVKLPDQVAKRGELDGLILHELTGILLLQIKATGYNFHTHADGCIPKMYVDSVQKAVEKAGRQLLRDRLVMSYIMEDLKLLDGHMTFVIALPNLTREMFELVLDACPHLKQSINEEFHLCYDNFLFAEEFHQEKGVYRNLQKWWTHNLGQLAKPKGFNMDMMKRIIFRTVGLLSTVSVWTCRQPRAEVRTLSSAVVETGKRFAQMVLSPRQAEILKREDQFLFIWGAAGSGKTLLLSLKGRHWQRKKYGVVILNTRLGTKGRDVGHVIEKTVNDSEDFKSLKRALRLDFDLKDDPSHLKEELLKLLSEKKSIKVILDEVTWMPETRRLLEFLKNLSKNIAIWCAGMLEEFCPEGFASERLYDVLRCPPFVQRLLKVVDNRDDRCQHYNISSARAGLSTDGPRPFFVIHSKHSQRNPSTVLPYDCPQCAQMVATFLKEKLQLSMDSSPALSELNDGGSNDKIRSFSHGEISVTDLPRRGSDEIVSKSRSNTFPNEDESVRRKKRSKKTRSHSRKGQSQTCGNPNSESQDTKGNGEAKEKMDRQNGNCYYGEENGNAGSHKDDMTLHDVNHRKASPSCGQVETRLEDHEAQGKTGSLEFSDVVLPVTMPVPWHRFNDRGYYCISDDALAQNMHLMGSSVFCTVLLDAGIPVKVETGMCMDVNSDDNENVLITCPVGKVHGLEYKVVICMPNFCALKETADFNEGIFQARKGPWTKMTRTSFGDQMVTKHPVFEERAIKERRFDEFRTWDHETWTMIKPSDGSKEVETDQIRISTHVHGSPDDLLYCLKRTEDDTSSSSSSHCPRASDSSRGDLCFETTTEALNLNGEGCHHPVQTFSDVNSPRNGRRDSDAKIAEESMSDVLQRTGNEDIKLEASSTVIAETVSFLSPSKSKESSMASVSQSSFSKNSKSTKPTASPGSISSSSSSQNHTSPMSADDSTMSQKTALLSLNAAGGDSTAVSPSLVGTPKTTTTDAFCDTKNVHEKFNVNDFTEEELRALNKLSDWDRAYVLMCASRCTAQLIMVLP